MRFTFMSPAPVATTLSEAFPEMGEASVRPLWTCVPWMSHSSSSGVSKSPPGPCSSRRDFHEPPEKSRAEKRHRVRELVVVNLDRQDVPAGAEQAQRT